jgi:hypothetical protein
MNKIGLGVGVLAALALVFAVPALAAVQVSAIGEVTAVDSVAGTFQIQTEEGDTYEVVPPDGFDLNSLSTGDPVLAEGTLAGGVITATAVVLLDEEVELTVIGEVTAVGDDSFEILTEDEEVFTVVPPDDFDLGSLELGDRVLVQGSLSDSEITASNVVELPADDDDDRDGPFDKDGYYCRTPSARHPALNRLALAYGEPYSELLYYFCEWRFGVGEIKLALQTAVNLGGSMDFGDILEMKREVGGWGQVWQQLGVRGNHEGGRPPWAGGNGQGHNK